MKKINFIILFAFTLCVVLLYADEVKMQNALADVSPTLSTTPINVQYNRDMWDIIFTFDCQSASQPGIETDGINIYTCLWNGPDFFKYEMDGTFVESFTIDGVSNIRDMAYDDTYFYGSPASMTINIMDLENQTLIGTIPVTCAGITGVRHIAYDPELDGGNGGFWIGNWDELGAITMSGAQIYGNINPAVQSLYGSAYDSLTGDGPYLWMFSQTGGAVLHQFEIDTQTFTGVTHDCSDIPGFNAGHAGGACIYYNSSFFILLVNVQQDPNLVAAYELADSPYFPAPGVPTDVLVIPDAGGALVTEISWVCPTLTWQGNPLPELLEMRVYRDNELIYTDFDPVMGGPGNYTDIDVPSSGLYDYRVVGYNSWGEGMPVVETVWVGEDVPAAVTDFVGVQTAPNLLSITLTWVNPTEGLHGGVFNEPILGYNIVRLPDNVTFELAGIATEYIDNTIPIAGNYYYYVTPYNVVGDGGTATSNDIIVYITGIENHQLPMTVYQLSNYPNPFKPSGAGRSPATTISFSLAKDAKNAEIVIYNLKGQKVKTFRVSNIEHRSKNHIVWDGKDENNKPVSSGVYFYKLKVNDKTIDTKKCLLLK